MPTDVVMPQMGESIAEGTIVRWIKKVGDQVDRDDPLFEISTDKVDAEIPSPAAGVLTEIRAQEGETVPVNSVVAIIGASGEAVAAPLSPPAPTPPAPSAPASSPAPRANGANVGQVAQVGQAAHESVEEAIRQRSSPLVRKIAKENGVNISQIRGSGIAGRVTKNDILDFIGSARGPREEPGPERGLPRLGGDSESSSAAARATGGVPEGGAPRAVIDAGQVGHVGSSSGPADQIEKMSVMRKRIAEHMILSRRTSAHVHSVFEVNFSRIAQIREARKAEFERAGAKLTYLSFIVKAAVDALRAVPIVNASVDGDNIVYHKDVNIGIAVALDWGLIVPVIKGADERNLLGLSRAIADLASRARGKQLKPDEVAGGTFTITNPGVFGALFGMPIINQPQVAILGVGHVEKRPVVVDDAIGIRVMAYLSLGYDHRVIDGAVADQFMSLVKRSLENWDPGTV